MARKILVVAQVFPPRFGGSGQWLWELYRRLPEIDVHVAAGIAAGDVAFDAQSHLPTTRLDLQLPSWGILRPSSAWRYARAFVRLNRLVSTTRPDMLHCGKCLPEGLLALAISQTRGVPFLSYAHGEELTLARTSRELRILTGRVLGAASKVIANSHFTQRLLIDEWGVPADKAIVMHPGVDTATFVPAPRDAAVRSRLGWTDRRVVLTVGALQKRKGQDMLIRALPAIRDRYPDVIYAVAGDGWEREYLVRLVDEMGVTDLVQFRESPTQAQLVELYQQCDLFALPNRKIGWDVEGFGMVLLEAQACGKRVLAGMSGGTADALSPGVTGELVACDAPDSLAEAVIRMLASASASADQRARAWAVDRFDWKHLRLEAARMFLDTVSAPALSRPEEFA